MSRNFFIKLFSLNLGAILGGIFSARAGQKINQKEFILNMALTLDRVGNKSDESNYPILHTFSGGEEKLIKEIMTHLLSLFASKYSEDTGQKYHLELNRLLEKYKVGKI